MGPYGAYLADGSEYRGDYKIGKDELAVWHKKRLDILTKTGADILACETIPCLEEAEALLSILGNYPETKAWLSFSCKDGENLSSGESFSKVFDLVN